MPPVTYEGEIQIFLVFIHLITHKQNNDWIHKIIWEYWSKHPLWAHHTNHYKLILNSNIMSMTELLIHNIKMAQVNSQITRGYQYKHALHICNIIRTDKSIQLPCISWTTHGNFDQDIAPATWELKLQAQHFLLKLPLANKLFFTLKKRFDISKPAIHWKRLFKSGCLSI